MARKKHAVTDVLTGEEVRQKILEGANLTANTVGITLGPKGRNVMIEKEWGYPHTTKDGVTVARDIKLSDSFSNMAAKYLQQAAGKTNAEAGDGTTTTTVLARAILREGSKMVSSGHNPMEIQKGLQHGAKVLVEALAEASCELEGFEQVEQVATVSANGDKAIGQLIASAMEQVGREGVITVDAGTGSETKLTVTEGMQYDQGFVSPYFITNMATGEATLGSPEVGPSIPLVLVYKGTLRSEGELTPLLQQVATAKRPLLIVAEDITADALRLLLINKERGTIEVVATKGPGFGNKRAENLVDIATLTGATLIDPQLGMKLEDFRCKVDPNTGLADLRTAKLGLDALGTANRVIVTTDSTTILEGGGDPNQIELRAAKIRSEMEGLTFLPELDFLNERLARLIGGIAVINVGAATESEMKEKQDRIDDALSATRAAVQEGIVPGGGVTLLRLAKSLKEVEGETHDFNVGIRILREACEEPLHLIVDNAGLKSALIIQDILTNQDFNYGFNARQEEYTNMLTAGIIDPAKVVRCAIENAVSAASLMLTTEAMIVAVEETD